MVLLVLRSRPRSQNRPFRPPGRRAILRPAATRKALRSSSADRASASPTRQSFKRSSTWGSAPNGSSRISSSSTASRAATTASNASCGGWAEADRCRCGAWSARLGMKPRWTSAAAHRSSGRMGSVARRTSFALSSATAARVQRSRIPPDDRGLHRCLENAFASFGGCPKVLVIDNLRAAVKHPDWFDPELVPKLRSFCQHYGITWDASFWKSSGPPCCRCPRSASLPFTKRLARSIGMATLCK